MAQWYRVGLLTVGSQVRTRLVRRFENLDFVRNLLFPLSKTFKSVVDVRDHLLRSGSPVTFFPGAAAASPTEQLGPALNLTKSVDIMKQQQQQKMKNTNWKFILQHVFPVRKLIFRL